MNRELYQATPIHYNVKSHSKNIRQLIDNSSLVITTQSLKDSLKKMSFHTPKLYGQIKLHKENHPIRPVTAAHSDPSFSLAKFLNNWFRTYTNFKPRFTIRNSLELTKKLSEHSFPLESCLCSFDVSSMYTRIPVTEIIELMCESLSTASLDVSVVNQFRKLISACISRNICSFQDQLMNFRMVFPWRSSQCSCCGFLHGSS